MGCRRQVRPGHFPPVPVLPSRHRYVLEKPRTAPRSCRASPAARSGTDAGGTRHTHRSCPKKVLEGSTPSRLGKRLMLTRPFLWSALGN